MTLQPAAFLDRDGVINVDRGYVFRPEDLVFTPTAIAGIKFLNQAGYRVIVVTNQSGVARGYFTMADVATFHAHINAELSLNDAKVDDFYICPYHPDGTIAEFAIDHFDRKPSPGLLLRAMRDLPVRRQGSFLVGDKPSDIDAAMAADLPGVLVPTDRCDLAAVVRRQIVPPLHLRLP